MFQVLRRVVAVIGIVGVFGATSVYSRVISGNEIQFQQQVRHMLFYLKNKCSHFVHSKLLQFEKEFLQVYKMFHFIKKGVGVEEIVMGNMKCNVFGLCFLFCFFFCFFFQLQNGVQSVRKIGSKKYWKWRFWEKILIPRFFVVVVVNSSQFNVKRKSYNIRIYHK